MVFLLARTIPNRNGIYFSVRTTAKRYALQNPAAKNRQALRLTLALAENTVPKKEVKPLARKIADSELTEYLQKNICTVLAAAAVFVILFFWQLVLPLSSNKTILYLLFFLLSFLFQFRIEL